jgi:hypothetical protein
MLGAINGLQAQKRANTFFLICWPGLPNSRKNSKLFLGISPFESSRKPSRFHCIISRCASKTRILEVNRRLARYLTAGERAAGPSKSMAPSSEGDDLSVPARQRLD